MIGNDFRHLTNKGLRTRIRCHYEFVFHIQHMENTLFSEFIQNICKLNQTLEGEKIYYFYITQKAEESGGEKILSDSELICCPLLNSSYCMDAPVRYLNLHVKGSSSASFH